MATCFSKKHRISILFVKTFYLFIKVYGTIKITYTKHYFTQVLKRRKGKSLSLRVKNSILAVTLTNSGCTLTNRHRTTSSATRQEVSNWLLTMLAWVRLQLRRIWRRGKGRILNFNFCFENIKGTFPLPNVVFILFFKCIQMN